MHIENVGQFANFSYTKSDTVELFGVKSKTSLTVVYGIPKQTKHSQMIQSANMAPDRIKSIVNYIFTEPLYIFRLYISINFFDVWMKGVVIYV